MAEITEQDILKIRLEAAFLERDAAQMRLQCAREEQAAMRKTLQMADAVAQSMVQREGATA